MLTPGGRTQENFKAGGDNLAANLAYQIFSPGYYSEDNTTAADNYIQSLYDNTGDSAVIPSKISRSYKINGVSKRLTGEEYSEAQKLAGSTAYDFVNALRMYSGRDRISESEQAEVTKKLYSLSKDIAMSETVGKDMSNANAKLYGIYQESGTNGLLDYLTINSALGTDDKKSLAETIPYLQDGNMSASEKGQYLINSGKLSLTKNNGKRSAAGFVYDDLGYEGVYEYAQIKVGADSNGNGSVSAEEAEDYLLGRTDLSNLQKAYYFSLLSTAKKNPFD